MGAHAPDTVGSGGSRGRGAASLPPQSYRTACVVPGGEGGWVPLCSGEQCRAALWARMLGKPLRPLGTPTGKLTPVASLLPDRTSVNSPSPSQKPGLQGGRAQAPGQRGPEGARCPGLEGECRGETGQG